MLFQLKKKKKKKEIFGCDDVEKRAEGFALDLPPQLCVFIDSASSIYLYLPLFACCQLD